MAAGWTCVGEPGRTGSNPFAAILLGFEPPFPALPAPASGAVGSASVPRDVPSQEPRLLSEQKDVPASEPPTASFPAQSRTFLLRKRSPPQTPTRTARSRRMTLPSPPTFGERPLRPWLGLRTVSLPGAARAPTSASRPALRTNTRTKVTTRMRGPCPAARPARKQPRVFVDARRRGASRGPPPEGQAVPPTPPPAPEVLGLTCGPSPAVPQPRAVPSGHGAAGRRTSQGAAPARAMMCDSVAGCRLRLTSSTPSPAASASGSGTASYAEGRPRSTGTVPGAGSFTAEIAAGSP